jgi:hypothetical protein
MSILGMAEPTSTIAKLTLRSAAPSAAHAHQATHLSGETIALAALGALVVLACLAWALARSLAFEPRWTLSARHAIAEAGFRASATWAELSDWARLGR